MTIMISSIDELIEIIQDEGKRKVLAAEMAKNSDAPDFKGMNFENNFATDPQFGGGGQQSAVGFQGAGAFGGGAGGTMGVSPPMGTNPKGPDDFEADPGMQGATAGEQSNAQAGMMGGMMGGGGGVNPMQMMGGMGKMADVMTQPGPQGGKSQIRPQTLNVNLQPNPVQLPQNVGGNAISALAELLARR